MKYHLKSALRSEVSSHNFPIQFHVWHEAQLKKVRSTLRTALWFQGQSSPKVLWECSSNQIILCVLLLPTTLLHIRFLQNEFFQILLLAFAALLRWLHPFFNPEIGTHGAQAAKSVDGISSGGFFGKGIGEGTLKYKGSETHTDFIISVISEEFGVVIIISILIIFLFFIYRVFKKVYLEKNEKIKLVLVGSITLIVVQVLIHVGVNIGLFPTTGMTLPFLSYGGSSIIGVSILSGIILNLTKRKIN